MSNRHESKLLKVQEVLADGMYSIPAYQRNYAWGVKEIEQLVADVRDYAQRNSQNLALVYYIGTLVVYERRTEKHQHWEVVDGQQRLTTLSLLVSVLRALHPELAPLMTRMPLLFECREASSLALQSVFAHPLQAATFTSATQDGATRASADDTSGASSIWAGRGIIESLLREMPEVERKAFAKFLLDRVQLLRVGLPPRTDLNHYFEVMNNRGEQLAKHEVLKAHLLGALQQSGDQAAMKMLPAVWDACAVMDRSVQSWFLPVMRKRLFAVDGSVLLVKDQSELEDCFSSWGVPVTAPKSLLQLIALGTRCTSSQPGKVKAVGDEDEDDESKAQFGAVINFPNFLLQVLVMMPGDEFAAIPLDDKHLLTAFKPLLLGGAGKIKEFVFRLLRCRFLLDQYVIKSSVDNQGDEEHWQLQRCKFRNDKAVLQWVNAFDDEGQCYAERLRMLQSALHVSYMLPTRKHWLQGVLRWLYRQKEAEAIDAQAFLLALEELVKAFVLEVGAVTTQSVTYEEVVRRNTHFFAPQLQDSVLVQALPQKLIYSQVRLVDFNFLDYLLWWRARYENNADAQERRDFAFTSSRRSIEHLHPQTELVEGDAWNSAHLHAFGNLCLVSHAMNSRLSNSGPEDKFKQLTSERRSQSLKVFSMYEAFVAEETWTACKTMTGHEEQMLALLKNVFASGSLIGNGLLMADTEEGVS
jgi:hypothetical protein